MEQRHSAVKMCKVCGFEVPGGECLNSADCPNVSSEHGVQSAGRKKDFEPVAVSNRHEHSADYH